MTDKAATRGETAPLYRVTLMLDAGWLEAITNFTREVWTDAGEVCRLVTMEAVPSISCPTCSRATLEGDLIDADCGCRVCPECEGGDCPQEMAKRKREMARRQRLVEEAKGLLDQASVTYMIDDPKEGE